MKTLLLIVDVQKQFIPKNESGAIFCKEVEELQKKYKNIAISKFINNKETFWVKYLQWNKMMENDASTELAFTPKENAFIYTNDSFSSVTDDLIDFLNKQKIDEIHLCGVDTDACILATAYALWDKKLPFKVLIDYCISSAGENTHAGAHHLMNKNLGFDIVVTRNNKK